MFVTRVQTNRPFDISFVAHPLPIIGECATPDEAKQPICGKLIMVPAYYVHTLEVMDVGANARYAVEALTQFARGFALRDRQHPMPGAFAPSEILFHVSPDNAKMAAWVESKGATSEDAHLYRLPL